MKNSFYKNLLTVSIFRLTLFIFLIVSQELMSQSKSQPIVSPEVHPDKTVTFRYKAPEATEVKLYTQFVDKQQAMVKDTNGVWSITLGPAKSDIYPYCFIVDKISVADPNNIMTTTNERFKYSLVDIPGDAPLVHAMQEVPHGNVTYCYYHSKTIGTTRPLVVYTPPGYEKNQDKKYPVLYLLHGSTDTEETWFKVGRVNLILDNLIAQNMAAPMIIVMPYANTSSTKAFTEDLIKDIIPYTQENYRIIVEREQRAVAGFSRGGGQTLNAGLLHPDTFAWVCAFSTGVNIAEYEKYFNEHSPDPALLNKELKLLWLSCGTEDATYSRITEFDHLLKKYNIKHETFFPQGNHTWMSCRLFISTITPLLFQN